MHSLDYLFSIAEHYLHTGQVKKFLQENRERKSVTHYLPEHEQRWQHTVFRMAKCGFILGTLYLDCQDKCCHLSTSLTQSQSPVSETPLPADPGWQDDRQQWYTGPGCHAMIWPRPVSCTQSSLTSCLVQISWNMDTVVVTSVSLLEPFRHVC